MRTLAENRQADADHAIAAENPDKQEEDPHDQKKRAPLKRGRGRPKKELIVPDPGVLGVKKRRGRPPAALKRYLKAADSGSVESRDGKKEVNEEILLSQITSTKSNLRGSNVSSSPSATYSSDDDDEEEEEAQVQGIDLNPDLVRNRRANGDNDESEDYTSLFLDGSEGYFEQHLTRTHISSHTLSEITPVLEQQVYQQIIEKYGQSLSLERQQFKEQVYFKLFTQWKFELSQTFSLLLYGRGSKRELLLKFVQDSFPQDCPILVVNGYNPATSLKEVLQNIARILVLDGDEDDTTIKLPSGLLDLADFIVRYLEAAKVGSRFTTPRLILAIHNLDGIGFRSDKAQAILSQIVGAAGGSAVYLVASIDHFNAPLLFNASVRSEYRFLWHDVSTFDPYTAELSFYDPLEIRNSGRQGANKVTSIQGVQYILSSLTVNARRLFLRVLWHQIESMTPNTIGGNNDDEDDDEQGQSQQRDSTSKNNIAGEAKHGIEFKTLYEQCSQEFVVTNELNMRTILGEFFEHNLLVSTRDIMGTEVIYSPFNKAQILQIYDLDELQGID